MWLPIISAIFCLAATVIIFCVGALVLVPLGTVPHALAQQKLLGQEMAPFVFLFYLATYSIAIFFNVALVSIASNRLAGGRATLNNGLQVAWTRKWRILQWALLAATVGMLLKMIEGRLKFLGRMIVGIIGFVWTLASFFVIPLLAAEDMGPVEALYKSAEIFRDTWGEEVTGGFSFGLIFFLLMLPGIFFPLLGAQLGTNRAVRRPRGCGDLLAASWCGQLSRSGDLRRGALPLRHHARGLGWLPARVTLAGAWQPKE